METTEEFWKTYLKINKVLKHKTVATDKKYIVAIGDVHGCYEEFDELIDKVGSFTKWNHHLISLGDLVHRGPDSQRSCELALQYCQDIILGNHEEKHARWYAHATSSPEKQNPVKLFPEEAIKIYSDTMAKVVDRSHHWIKVNNTIFLHGGMMPTWDYNKQDPKVLIRLRNIDNSTGHMVRYGYENPNSIPWYEFHKRPERLVYGHSVWDLKEPRVVNNTYGIDTGLCFGGHLTAYLEDTETGKVSFIQQPAYKTYYEMKEQND